MSNIKISELPQAQPITGDEQVPIVQDGVTVRTTAQTLVSSSVVDISQSIIADAGSTTKVPSVNATKTYVDGLVLGLVDDRGNFTPSPTVPGGFPTLNGSGAGGQIMKGDLWFIDAIGYINSVAVTVGQSIRALQDNPLQDPTKWNILSAGLIQSTLQNVLTAGNTADNQSITLYDTGHTMSSRVRYDQNLMSSTSGATLATDADKLRAYNSITTNIVEANNASDPYVKVYRGSTNKYTSLFSDSLKYSNSGFLGRLSSSNLTASQTWTLPDATGTIALANNIWNATGNSGTIAGANFLGTIDTVDLVIKTNNLERIRVANTGGVIISDLAGTGTRTVVASSTGQLSTTISSSGWSTLGNASTSPLTNFIGTTDNQDLVFRTNNFEALRINTNGEVLGSVKMQVYSPGAGQAGFYVDAIDMGTLMVGNITATGLIQALNLTTSQTYQLPDASGTIPLSVNGNTADSAGEITLTIPTVTLQVATAGTNKNLTNGINLQGTNAGASNSGTNINAFGTFAGNFNSGSRINAFGNTATENNTGNDINALGNTSAFQNAGTDVNALGNTSAILNLGSHVNALGKSAASSNSGSGVNAMGQQAASSNSGTAVNAMGDQSAYVNSGSDVNAFGTNAAQTNTGDNVNALGANAASGNTGSDVNAFGLGAGTGNTLSGMTIFSNDSMPSYADYAAASAAITVMLGATAGCTYLYHDQATNSIGAVRL